MSVETSPAVPKRPLLAPKQGRLQEPLALPAAGGVMLGWAAVLLCSEPLLQRVRENNGQANDQLDLWFFLQKDLISAAMAAGVLMLCAVAALALWLAKHRFPAACSFSVGVMLLLPEVWRGILIYHRVGNCLNPGPHQGQAWENLVDYTGDTAVLGGRLVIILAGALLGVLSYRLARRAPLGGQ